MSDAFTRLIEISQKTERLLERRFGAQGRGLHEKLSSIEAQIPQRVQHKIRFIATIRNKATHEDVGIAEENLPAVRQAFCEILPFLDGGESRRKAIKRNVYVVVGFIALAVVVFYLFRG